MKILLSFVCAVSLFPSLAFSQHHLTRLWSTDSSLKVPESVLIDPATHLLYVSNIDGKPDEKDGKGSIGKLNAQGRILSVDWVSGLQAPKGMGLYQNRLYVADVDAVVIIDVKKAAIIKRVPVKGAVFLNDVTIDPDGVVFVSDSRAGKVYKMENGTVSLYLDKLKNPNGLLAVNHDLYMLDSGVLYKVLRNKTFSKIAEGMEPDTDGLVHISRNEFIASCWGGSVYYIKNDGSKEKLLDTRGLKINTADIQYDGDRQVLYVPTFAKNSVVAYKVSL